MTTPLSNSLALLIGRQIFDGAAPEALAKKHRVSVDDINQAWFSCKEQLSRHFANKEHVEYRLLNDNDLQARLHAALILLLDWREAALYVERLEKSNAPTIEENDARDNESQPD